VRTCEFILTALTAPARAGRQLAEGEPFVPCAVVVALATFGGAVNELLVCRAAAGYRAAASFVIWAFMVNLGLVVLATVAGTVLISFFLHLLGARVRVAQLFWVVPLSMAPWMFASSIGLVAAGIGGPLGGALSMPGYLVLVLWHLGVLVALVAQVGQTDVLRSLLAVAMSVGSAMAFCWGASVAVFLSLFNFLIAVKPPVP